MQTYKVTSKYIGLHNSFYALSPRRGSNTGDEGEHQVNCPGIPGNLEAPTDANRSHIVKIALCIFVEQMVR